jgi:hypothetical protein
VRVGVRGMCACVWWVCARAQGVVDLRNARLSVGIDHVSLSDVPLFEVSCDVGSCLRKRPIVRRAPPVSDVMT